LVRTIPNREFGKYAECLSIALVAVSDAFASYKLIELLFCGMAKWRVPQVVRETSCLNNLLVNTMNHRQLSILSNAMLRKPPTYLRYLISMLLARMKNIELTGSHYLRYTSQSMKGG